MSNLVAFPLGENEEDGFFVVETADQADGDIVRISADTEVPKATETLKSSLEKIKPALRQIAATLKDINEPREIAVEVGLKFSGKVGIVFASLDSEVSFKVTLKWQNS
jgi:hypothetical protein